MAIDVTWRIIKKWCIWSFHLHNFLCLPVFVLFLQKIRRMSRNYLNFIYIYLKLKLGTPECICLKWVFLPQWDTYRFLYIKDASFCRNMLLKLIHFKSRNSGLTWSRFKYFSLLATFCSKVNTFLYFILQFFHCIYSILNYNSLDERR